MQRAPACPKCENATLKPSPRMGRGGRDEVPAMNCLQCQGMWLSRTEADLLARQGPSTEGGVTEEVSPTASEADRRTGLCPFGHGLMSRARVELETAFYLERCLHCGGVWFDAGEWQRLATSHLLGSLMEFWTPAWRWRSQQEKVRKAELERLATRLGPELFAQLQAVADGLRNHPSRDEALSFLFSASRPGDRDTDS